MLSIFQYNCTQMIFGILLRTTEDGLGRVDYTSLSDQVLMEMLVEGFDENAKKTYQNADGMFLDVCDWENILCDKWDRVVSVKGAFVSSGSITLAQIPPKVKDFALCKAHLRGTLETSSLPASIEKLYVSTNELYGSVGFTAFPESLVEIGIDTNAFSGSADLSALPRSLMHLWMQNNTFSGTLRLNNLPPTLVCFSIGTNAFSGEFRLENAPKPLYNVFAFCNSFNPTAIVPSDKCVRLTKSGVTAVVDEKGNTHRQERYMIQT